MGLALWIKLESIFMPSFYSPHSLLPAFTIERYGSTDTEIQRMRKENWTRIIQVRKNPTSLFDEQECNLMRKLRENLSGLARFGWGMDDWADIFLQVQPRKLNKFKGFLSLFINLFSIVRTLAIAAWDFEKDPDTKQKIRPPYVFENAEEGIKYRQGVLIDYDLVAEDLFLIFVEGATEVEILKHWFEVFRNFGPSDKIGIRNYEGEKNWNYSFGVACRNFPFKKHFLFRDADNPEKEKQITDELRKGHVLQHDFHISNPDFVSENFTIDQILRGYQNWLASEGILLLPGDIEQLKRAMEQKKAAKRGYEQVLVDFHNNESVKVKYTHFSKPKLGQYLAPIAIEIHETKQLLVFEDELRKYYEWIEGFTEGLLRDKRTYAWHWNL